MDTSEKVKVFSSLDALTQEIIRDRENKDFLAQRYSVRFIMLNNFIEFKSLAKFMTSIGIDTLDLEDLMSDGEDDEWITKDTLKDAIKACKKPTFVTPFSEVVRFYNDDDFRGFFNEIMLLEDIHNPQKRIYIPLIGLQNRFTDFLNHFARIQESAPIWRYDAETQSVEVFFAKYKSFTLPNGTIQCQLDSLRQWLKFWKVQAPQERIVCTSLPIAAKYKYSKPDNIFNFKKIDNAYDFMTQFLEMRFPFEYNADEKSFWEELLKTIDKTQLETFTFEKYVRRYFNKVQFDAAEIIEEWADLCRKPFDRWLLKNYVLHTNFADTYPYLTMCMESTATLDDTYTFPNMVATRALYGMQPDKKEQYAAERRQIMVANRFFFEKTVTTEDQNWLFDQIKDVFQEQNDLKLAIDLCTGIFDFEQKLLMGWYVHQPNAKNLQVALDNLYPELPAYIESKKPSQFDVQNQWAIDYIKAYKQAKLTDKYTEDIANTIKSKNGSSKQFYQWYYMFKSSHELLAELQSNMVYRPDKVYWIDGLGVEFLSYILYLIEKEDSNLKVVRSEITRSELPSSTHHNRFEGEDVVKYGALDELGHDSHGYKQFETLAAELRVIKKIIQDIINTSKKEKCTIAIVSDHGLSCLSRKAASKKYDGKFEHEGRYIKAEEGTLDDPDYIVYDNSEESQKYKVALTHASLSKAPTHQVHGGCTPEEVLVPFLLLSNKDVTSNVHYQINLSPEDIMLSNPTVSLTVIPLPAKVTLTCEGKAYLMERKGTAWSTTLQDITEGKHKIDVQVEGAESVEMDITIVGVGSGAGISDLIDF